MYWVEATRRTIDSWRSDLLARDPAGFIVEHLEALANTALELARAMEFGFLLDTQRKLLSIGYRATDGTLDPSCYDLLASEARLASFVAIAKGDIPARHWFRLGRTVTPIGAGAALVSWSGSMFEYLMPDLVLRAPGGSLLAQTSRLIVKRQIEYGEELSLPWGVSESAYNARDLELTYQYSNFGVPGLGLKRGLSENKVVAPYATGLAAMVDGEAALANYAALAAIGARGRYGFYEAVDFTPSRLPEGSSRVLVRAYMAHHQGMSIVAIANALLDGRMRERFHSDVAVQATELLLQERTPRDVSVAHPRAEEVGTAARITRSAGARGAAPAQPARFRAADSPALERPLLGHGHGRGLGLQPLERSGDHALARRRDARRHRQLLPAARRRQRAGVVGRLPALRRASPTSYEVSFTEDRAEIIRGDGDLVTTLEVQVSSEDDAEVRRLSISNASARAREIEVTSYAELVLGAQAADVAHPAFSKMFVRTEFVARQGVLLANRRRRAPDEPEIWASHHAVIEGSTAGHPNSKPIARVSSAAAANCARRWPCSRAARCRAPSGTVLDAVFALRYRMQRAGRRHGAHRVLDLRGGQPRAGARTRRQASRYQRAHARRHAGLDAGAGAAAAPGHRRLAGQPVPAARRPHPVRRRRRAPGRRRHPSRRRPARRRCGRRASRAICPSC